ncbi:MAG: membrane protein insertion efficiency factor YidD [Bacteroidia bacterium]
MGLSAKAQPAAELAYTRAHVFAQNVRAERFQFDWNRSNEIDFLTSFSFVFYKRYISSQDAISCTFEPSCSVFGLHAVRHHGLVIGSMATFDRLARCHGWNRNYYSIHPTTQLNYDPIDAVPAH